MNEMERNAALRTIFKVAMASDVEAGDPGQDHPLDNDELLIDWSVGDLDATRHRAVLDHLAECSYCRRELADMIRAGALLLPEQENAEDADNVAEPVATVRRDQSVASPNRNIRYAIAAIAASLLVAVIWALSGRGGDSMLAMARRDLQAGRHTAALERVEGYLDQNKDLADDDRIEAERILEDSGYQLARKSLAGGEFKNVLDIEDRTSRRSVDSARLTNLRIQAQRGETAERTLTTKGVLTDYGYERDGHQYTKGFPTFDATTARLAKELAAAVQKYPDSPDLLLNYGQFLIDQNDFERAVRQFTAAVEFDPNSPLAHTGLGLVLFQQEKDETIRQALTHFRKAVKLDPNNAATNLNLAVCLVRLGKKDEAARYFEKNLELRGEER